VPGDKSFASLIDDGVKVHMGAEGNLWANRRFKPANVLNEGLAANDRKQYSFFVRN
jgi:hypothetical protein